ncbi:MAG TPA: SH3 domain-containing protein [Aestuariivirgaceae bacterium]|nr:SH3 domain-containing protein [Aestuariivirgaceae bacterium]
MLGNRILAVGAVIAGVMLPAQAMAYEAYTRVDLNLRVGPDTTYGIIDVIPWGDPVEVLGCLELFAWCDVEWYGLRGWVAATYLVQPDNPTVYLPQFAPRIGLPIVTFSFVTYHDRYYRDRPWYRERYGRWEGHDYRRGDRPRSREEVRERIRQETRRENREERVEQRRDNREERVEQRREKREDTRETRRERRQQTEQPQESLQQRQKPRQQRDAERPKQQREARPQQQQQRETSPRQGERTQRQGERTQRQGDRPKQGKRVQRQGNGGSPEELLNERGQ